MAYTILKSDGTPLTTIPDGTINTTSTSLGLPGRNYAGYGQTIDTNFVHQLESFADGTPPANPLRGQLWFNTNNSTLYVCPTDGETNAANWLALSATGSGGTTTFGAVTVTGNISANNITAINTIGANSGLFNYITVSILGTIGNANITTANLTTTRTAIITTGSNLTPGTLTGTWTANGGNSGNTLSITNGNLVIDGGSTYGIKTDKYMYANGAAISFSGTYGDSNVAAYLPTYNGNILLTRANVTQITTGAAATSGNITGNWTLTAGSKLNATYADLAERFEADTEYDAGTVVELGGDKEITAVKYELSEDVFGVISDTAGYLLNATAGDDKTHPPVAVSGRVKVKVKGTVKKGDRLVSAGKGIARAAKSNEINAFNTIGRALTDKTTDGLGTVEAIVVIK
jgi:hypothetical protein